MPKLYPLKPDDPTLRKVCHTVNLPDLRHNSLQSDIENLLDYVHNSSNKGDKRDRNRPSTVGLSANQVGLDLSITVVDLGIGHKSYNDLHVLINPMITWSSKTIIEHDEGCVNLDHIRGFVKRSSRIKLDAYDRSGNKISLDVHGWPAVLLQHEVDHLNGKLFIDKLEDPKKAFLVKDKQLLEYKKLKKDWNKFIDVTSLIN
jgi:peptide deformylase